MNCRENIQWREAGLRRPLTDAELAECKAFLETHSAAARELEDDLALNQLLRQLPNKPVSNNFTAQVLATIKQPSVTLPPPVPSTSLGWLWSWAHRQLPRWALAGLLIGIGLFSYHQHQRQSRIEWAQSIEVVSDISTLVPVEVWQNYDAIVRLSHVPSKVDEDLLSALEH